MTRFIEFVARGSGRSLTAATSVAILILAVTVLATHAADGNETVVITDTLRPAEVVIAPGTTVTWRNQDDERHRLRSKDGPAEFDSGNLERGESYSFTFSVEGAYPYYDHRDRDDAAYFGTIVVGSAAPDPDAPLPENGTVSIIDRSFRPTSIAIASSGTVEWSNDDGEAHTVTATDNGFDSGIVNGGAAFSQTFDQAGSYPYFCAIHPEMRGVITVSDPSADPVSDPAADPDPAVTTLSSPLPSGAEGAASVTHVSIIDFSFQPEAVEVAVGSDMTWSNDDDVGHTVTAVDGSFGSAVLTVGGDFSTTFDAAGKFDYFCAIHPAMTGTVVVVEAGAQPSGPSPPNDAATPDPRVASS